MHLLWLPTLVAALASANSECTSSCREYVVNFEEDTCQPFRDQLPRPTLYNICVESYRKSESQACDEFCNNGENAEGNLGTFQAQACDHLRTIRPREALTVCTKTYHKVVTYAKEYVVIGVSLPPKQPPAQPAAPASVAATDDKKPEKVKIEIEPKKKTPLEAARDEAKFAFETDSARLTDL
ncbi:Aste57867_7537 [Aphanomyces stellatus]|uniref:Aste57867_7537 protein n=1 Tax=Aphanomyces stellatus TaxID=120398 RepID=A0A485KIH7_9STRA|nr:hypothetical protein As57867_007511 [Aphanomyces stellatus]VFT84446.1 Aste57867_7537 [Aphanomyces stellatus]